MKKIFCAVLLTIIFVANVCCAANFKIKMLNVGQGDAFLIQSESENILIDTSDVDERKKLLRELYKADCFKINKLILTHPHADHIGNAAHLIKIGTISVKSVYDNGKMVTSKYYLDYLNECFSRDVPHYSLNVGDKISLDDGAYLEVLNTNNDSVNSNNDSIVGRFVYKNFSMLFTADAERAVENSLLKENISSVVLQAGHHGSQTSNSANFVQTVKPKYVLISAGEHTTSRGGNNYGHPHCKSLENFLIAGVQKENIFWTAKNGTVTIETDGNKISVTPEIKNNWVDSYMLEQTGYITTVKKI